MRRTGKPGEERPEGADMVWDCCCAVQVSDLCTVQVQEELERGPDSSRQRASKMTKRVPWQVTHKLLKPSAFVFASRNGTSAGGGGCSSQQTATQKHT